MAVELVHDLRICYHRTGTTGSNTTGRSEVRIEEFKTKPTDGRVSEDLERKKAAVAASRGAEYATAIQGHLVRRKLSSHSRTRLEIALFAPFPSLSNREGGRHFKFD